MRTKHHPRSDNSSLSRSSSRVQTWSCALLAAMISTAPIMASPKPMDSQPTTVSADDKPAVIVARPLPLADVRLTGGPLKRAQDVDAAYLLQLEPDRMLA